MNRFATDEDRAVVDAADERLAKFETRILGREQERIPAAMQLCSLGSGNHFISLERSEKTGEIYLLVHSGSRQYGTFVCKGKGNEDWNQSAPHGAGRLMSRADAKELLDLESVRATLGELFTTTVGSSLDEAPDAYKSFDFIREHITPTAEVADRLVPLYNLKG